MGDTPACVQVGVGRLIFDANGTWRFISLPVDTPAVGRRELSGLSTFLDAPREVTNNGGSAVTDLRDGPDQAEPTAVMLEKLPQARYQDRPLILRSAAGPSPISTEVDEVAGRHVSGAGMPRSGSSAFLDKAWVTPVGEVMRERLRERLASIEMPTFDPNDCMVRLEKVRSGFYGPASRAVRDDSRVNTGRPQDAFAAAVGGDWQPVEHSLNAVVKRLTQLGSRSAAFILESSPSVPARHGFVVVNESGQIFRIETQRPEPIGPKITHAREGWPLSAGARVIVVNRSGKAVPLTLNSPVTAASTHNALVDPPRALHYGAGGLEGETQILVLFPPTDQPRSEGAILVTAREDPEKHVKLKLDHTRYFVGDRDGLLHGSRRKGRERGNTDFTLKTLAITEVVSPVWAIGPGDEGLPLRAHVLGEFYNMVQYLYQAPKLSKLQRVDEVEQARFYANGLPADAAFPPQSGWEVQFVGRNAHLLQPLDETKGLRIFFQYTYDIPPSRLWDVHHWALEDDNTTELQSRIIDDGMEFAEDLEKEFKKRRRPRRPDAVAALNEESYALKAYILVVYTHVAAQQLGLILEKYILTKNLLVLASRTPLHVYRARLLPGEVSKWIDINAEHIINRFDEKLRSGLQDIHKNIARIAQTFDIEERVPDTGTSGREYLESSLRTHPQRLVGQYDGVGMQDGFELGPSGDKITVEFRFGPGEKFGLEEVSKLDRRLDKIESLIWPDRPALTAPSHISQRPNPSMGDPDWFNQAPGSSPYGPMYNNGPIYRGGYGHAGSSSSGYGGHYSQIRIANTAKAMVVGLFQAIANRQNQIRIDRQGVGQPVDEDALRAAYATDSLVQALRRGLSAWTTSSTIDTSPTTTGNPAPAGQRTPAIPPGARWAKSSHSGNDTPHCVEVTMIDLAPG